MLEKVSFLTGCDVIIFLKVFYFNIIVPKIQFQAYEICISRGLVREQVFILGRMGNSKQALAVIINKLGDIEEV